MNQQPTIRGQRINSAPSYPERMYVYRGDVPLEKDPDVLKSLTHGNASAARLHYLRGEKPCDECRESERARWRDAAKRKREKGTVLHKQEFTADKCGTNAGHQRHMYYGNTACEPCMAAHRAYQKARREALKEKKS